MPKKTGIVGFGAVGKSTLKFLSKSNRKDVFVWDKRDLSQDEVELVKSLDAEVSKSSLADFIKNNDSLIVSPGIDLRDFYNYKEKFICELDLFSKENKNSTIAITGTLGKTSITDLIGNVIKEAGLSSVTCGNIGYPMLDTMGLKEDNIVLELSSFQLEHSKFFAPDIAMLTNFYPNHLDRHGSIKDYLNAKFNIFDKQSSNQFGIFHIDTINGEYKELLEERLSSYKGASYFIYKNLPKELENSFYINKDCVFREGVPLCDLSIIPDNTFIDNWLFVIAVMSLLGFDRVLIEEVIGKVGLSSSSHRMELFHSSGGVDFYNDSKSTVMQATIAAIKKLSYKKRPIVLVLGGLDKGVDRSILSDFISKQELIKKVFFLGKDTGYFSDYEQYSSLTKLVHAIMRSADSGDQVLFSPSGSSFDLFKNYKERGEMFKEAVMSCNVR